MSVNMYITAFLYIYKNCFSRYFVLFLRNSHGFKAWAVFLSRWCFWHNNCVFTCVNLKLKT